MFGPGVDWKQPQTGGLLSQLIVKEDAQLSEPKPRVRVKNIWDPNDLAGRATDWRDVKPRSENIPAAKTNIRLADTRVDGHRRCRSDLLMERRMGEYLNASRAVGAAGNLTAEQYGQLRPTYGKNDSFSTDTTSH